MNTKGITMSIFKLPELDIRHYNPRRDKSYMNPIYRHGHLYEIYIPMLANADEFLMVYAMPEVFCFNGNKSNMRLFFHANSIRCYSGGFNVGLKDFQRIPINTKCAFTSSFDNSVKTFGFDIRYGREVSLEEIRDKAGQEEFEFFQHRLNQLKLHDANTIRLGHPMFVRFEDITIDGETIGTRTRRFSRSIQFTTEYGSCDQVVRVSETPRFKANEIVSATFYRKKYDQYGNGGIPIERDGKAPEFISGDLKREETRLTIQYF